MKYVITGSVGHISKPLAGKLVKAGHSVDVISSNADRADEIKSLGATPVIGSIEDGSFLSEAFRSADAVYTMIPSSPAAADLKKHIASIGKNYSEALMHSSVKQVVNLSSVGAHMPEGCGPVSGLYWAEQELNALPHINVLHLRPGYFYYNFFNSIEMIRTSGILGGNYGANTKLVMAHTDDIAEVAAEALMHSSFSDKSIRYIASDEKTTNEIAAILGRAIGKPDLKWIDFTDEQTLSGLMQAGLPEEMAKNYTEMGAAIRSGEMFSDYFNSREKTKGKISLVEFSKEFAPAYRQHEKVAS